MKNLILVAMTVLTLTGSAAHATSGWDYFWGTTVSQGLDPKLNGWDDFWGQCQNEERTDADCAGTVFAGLGLAIIAPVAATAAIIVGATSVPTMGFTALMPFVSGASSFAIP